MTISDLGAQRSQYTTDAVLSASPVRLLTMLYDRLLLDLDRARIAQPRQDWPVVSENLLHAQAIVAELAASLQVESWDGASSLLALYHYCQSLMVGANVRRELAGIDECIELLEPIRQAWHEAAGQLSAAVPPVTGLSRELGVA
ncbi:MAG TPA: flagellar export chaperone FliS [Lacisediminihabitans sp.]|uniref:flagellar export chaperone FliS n=1 Tax=Lacisediminihabitans sp. TaxID=2787631 RepID=UPI002EDB4ED4